MRSALFWCLADVAAIIVFGVLAVLHVLSADAAGGFILAILAGKLNPVTPPGGGDAAPSSRLPRAAAPSGLLTMMVGVRALAFSAWVRVWPPAAPRRAGWWPREVPLHG